MILKLITFVHNQLSSGQLSGELTFGQTEKKSPAPILDNKVNYTETIIVDSSKKDMLYGKAKLWFANAFKSANDVVQLDDKDNGIILGKGTIIKNEMTGLQSVKKTWKFTVKIQVKDGKYKAEIYDIDYTFEMPGNNINASPVTVNLDQYFNDSKNYKDDGTPRNKTAKFGAEANDNFNALLASIKKAMTEKLKSDF